MIAISQAVIFLKSMGDDNNRIYFGNYKQWRCVNFLFGGGGLKIKISITTNKFNMTVYNSHGVRWTLKSGGAESKKRVRLVVKKWPVLPLSIKLLSLSVISDLSTFGNTIYRK